MTDTWDELDALCDELHALNEEASERRAQLAAELESLRSMLDLLDRHDADLAPGPALEAVRTRLLGGAGVVQRTLAAFGLDRLLVLAWPAAADPRPDLSGAAGEYRVEVWLGLSEQGRARVRVVGAKRLEATLPVPVEKFRAVLLDAVRAPAFTPYPAAEGAEESAEPAPAPEPTAAGERGADPSAPPPATAAAPPVDRAEEDASGPG